MLFFFFFIFRFFSSSSTLFPFLSFNSFCTTSEDREEREKREREEREKQKEKEEQAHQIQRTNNFNSSFLSQKRKMASNLENDLFEAIQKKDIQGAKDLLQKQEINLNCQDEEVFFLFISFSFSLFFGFDLGC